MGNQLESALAAASYEEFTDIVKQGSDQLNATTIIDTPLGVGNAYYALDPCRIVDTRIASSIFSGPVDTGTVANFYVRDSFDPVNFFVIQGGSTGACGVPDNAEAVVVNITSTQQGGQGHLRAYPWGIDIPLPSILNFSGNNVANSTILPICTTACSYDFSIYASMSTHVVVDVMGYFAY